MNRRAFIGSLTTMAAAAYLSPNVLATSAPMSRELYFKDVPLTSNVNVQSNAMYFFARDAIYKSDAGRIHRLTM